MPDNEILARLLALNHRAGEPKSVNSLTLQACQSIWAKRPKTTKKSTFMQICRPLSNDGLPAKDASIFSFCATETATGTGCHAACRHPPCFRSLVGAVALRDVFDDGEAEAGAAGLARAGTVDPVEAFGEPRNVLGAMPRRCRTATTTDASSRATVRLMRPPVGV